MFTIILQAQSASSPWTSAIFMVLIVGIFYFFMIRPQQKKAKDQKKFVESVKKGDQVVTIGGAHGRVAEVESNYFILEFERGVRIKFLKSSVSMESTKSVTEADKTNN